jgi:hypothetical protein
VDKKIAPDLALERSPEAGELESMLAKVTVKVAI